MIPAELKGCVQAQIARAYDTADTLGDLLSYVDDLESRVERLTESLELTAERERQEIEAQNRLDHERELASEAARRAEISIMKADLPNRPATTVRDPLDDGPAYDVDPPDIDAEREAFDADMIPF